ncbi:alpha/beta fold hydrolase [Roseicitreum antarcticum]|nr:alpha/beta hydrolase [Roseicitreum antarcticum]
MQSALPAQFDVVTYEPRGLGRSDAPPGLWSMRDYADDAVSLLDTLQIPQALVLGESFGGMTALHLAAYHPDRLRGLAVMAATAGGAAGRSYPIEEWLNLDAEATALAALKVQDQRFRQLLRTDPAAAAARLAQRIAMETAFRACPANAAGYPRLLQARAGHDAVPVLPQISCPTIVMAGRHDNQASFAAVKWLSDHLPKAEFWVFDGGHGFGFATPDPMARLIAAWTAAPYSDQENCE